MHSEPVLMATTVAAAIVALASIFDVVLELSTVETIIAAVLPIIAGLIAREKVTPVA